MFSSRHRRCRARAFAWVAVVFGAAATGTPSEAQSLPSMVGDRHEAVVAALKARSLPFEQRPAAVSPDTTSCRITYVSADENVALDFSLWPESPNAPARAFSPGRVAGEKKVLTLTHIQITGPNSEAHRAWRRTLSKEGHSWYALPASAERLRSDADRKRYPAGGFLQWFRPNPDSKIGGRVPSVTFLLQTARPVGAPPGTEMTVLDVSLENPYKPRVIS